MYNGPQSFDQRLSPNPVPMQQSEHFEIANKMAQEIVSRFEPAQQNEIAKHIIAFIREQRNLEIQELQVRAESLAKISSEIFNPL
jgi:NADP-dependent 3-hydroxy acid dehydrogenase YdfG